ncbi:MAG: S41 family peptidase [Rhodothermales bacterium]
MRRRKIAMFGVGILIVGVVLGMQIGSAISSDDTYESMKKVEQAFAVINKRYVDDVDPTALAEEAIDGMLDELDPHSIYINAERMRDVTENFNASFEGIGISYEFVEGGDEGDTLAVLNPLPGGPSETVGLWSGDRIVAVDDSSAIGFTQVDVERKLKGARGTKVDITVVRPGYEAPLDFTITRDKIPLHTLDVAYMLDNQTGYIKLQRFARTTYNEFMEASRELKKEGMQRMVLDLRNNTGGFMDMAVRISDEFVSGDKIIVSSKSRHTDFSYENRARVKGLLEDMPVIVLVNEQSASASEIVAGALQDHDRGLIVGRRTFGKGLVQKQFPFKDGSVLRMTISRYYTPSGRFIQTPYNDGNKEDYYKSKFEKRQDEVSMNAEDLLGQIPDSLKYLTSAGRTVVGGGGILPDFIIRRDSISLYVQAVLGQQHDTEFVRKWIDSNSDQFHKTWSENRSGFLSDFQLSDQAMNSFDSYLEEQGIHIVADTEGYESTKEERYFTRKEVDEERAWMKNLLKARIASRMFDPAAWYPVRHDYDVTLNQAMGLWGSAEQLLAMDE